MFKIHEITAALVALVLIALAFVYGLFHVTLAGLIVCLCVLVIGGYIGVLLGRRSKTANEIADSVKERLDAYETILKRMQASMEFFSKSQDRSGNG